MLISSRFPDLSDTLRDRISGDRSSTRNSRQESRHATFLHVDQIMPTVIKAQGGPSPTVTYITDNAIGVQQKGRYRLDRVLGEGAFGRVYLGFDVELHRQVAIKVPTKARFQKPAGFSVPEAAKVLGLPTSTANVRWEYA